MLVWSKPQSKTNNCSEMQFVYNEGTSNTMQFHGGKKDLEQNWRLQQKRDKRTLRSMLFENEAFLRGKISTDLQI